MVWKLFEKARRLSIKMTEFLIDDRVSDPELNEWQKESEAANRTIKTFFDAKFRNTVFSHFENIDNRLVAGQLYHILGQQHRRKFIRRISAVAATVVFLAGSVILIYSLLKSQPAENIVAGIIPGCPQAVLILSDGEKMSLSQLTRINEKDGTAITRTQKGEVAYNAVSSDKRQNSYNTIIVPRFGEFSVILSDGTRVKLNSESELKYPTVFSGAQREVFLTGEAYFEVSKSNHPFIVHNYNAQIKVYGTSFNINSYNPEQIHVVLIRGEIGVSNNSQPEILLLPNQLAQIDRQNGITIRKNINPDYYTAWQNGYFAFERERLEDILKTLARWYNFEVLYARPELKDVLFTASIKRDHPLKDILQQFQNTGSLSYRINGNQIIIQEGEDRSL